MQYNGLYLKPQYSSSKSSKPRKVKHSLSVQYNKRVADGLHVEEIEWDVMFKSNPPTIEALDAFLTELGGTTSFRWKPDSNPSRVFICEEWSTSIDNEGYSSLSATFKSCQEDAPNLALRCLDGTWILDGAATLDFLYEN